MTRTLITAHSDLIATGYCGEVTTLDLILMLSLPKTFTAALTDILTCTNHGLLNGDKVIVRNDDGFLPKPFDYQTVYHVRDVTTNTLKLAPTAGGAAIDITWIGSGTNKLVKVTILYLATKDVLINGIQYLGNLRPSDEGLKMTNGQIVDRMNVEVQNVDKAMGLSITGQVSALDGALGIIGTIHQDLSGGLEYYDARLPGEIRSAVVDEAEAKVAFTVESDLEAEYTGEIISERFPFRDVPPPPLTGVIDDRSDPNDFIRSRKSWLFGNLLED
jgi:hypothetical protein